MPREIRRMPLELGLDLNINRLIHEGFIVPGQITEERDVYWLKNDGKARITAKIISDTRRISTLTQPESGSTMRIVADWIDQTIYLVARPRHFGGHQCYFLCPIERRSASVLWSPPSQKLFASRKAWGSQVAYLSQYYNPGCRARYMAFKMCDRIGGPGASQKWEVPPKPKGMRWRTYERLSDRCMEYYEKGSDADFPKKFILHGDVV